MPKIGSICLSFLIATFLASNAMGAATTARTTTTQKKPKTTKAPTTTTTKAPTTTTTKAPTTTTTKAPTTTTTLLSKSETEKVAFQITQCLPEYDFETGRYVCKDFARDFTEQARSAGLKVCELVLGNSRPDVFIRNEMPEEQPTELSFVRTCVHDPDSIYQKCCAVDVYYKKQIACWHSSSEEVPPHVLESISRYYFGHSGGPTDPHQLHVANVVLVDDPDAATYYYCIVEPQSKNSPAIRHCWHQADEFPIVPPAHVLEAFWRNLVPSFDTFGGLISVKYEIRGCDEPTETPTPSPTHSSWR